MVQLSEGQTIQVPGSGSAMHTIKYVGGVYSCSCPAWRFQSRPIDERTCKHIDRMGYRNTAASRAPATNGKPQTTNGKPQTTTVMSSPAAVVMSAVNTPAPRVEPKAPPVLLAHTWDKEADLTGWWMSEKLDGVRCWWTGEKFLSREGNEYRAPAWFTKDLPKTLLDGELWMGRKMFQQTVSIVRMGNPRDDLWRKLTFMVFDAPEKGQPFENRMVRAERIIAGAPYAKFVDQVPCEGINHIRKALKAMIALGGEGLMMRSPMSMYEEGRSYTLLKVKEFFDAEGTVIGYEPGKGKHKGRVGALIIKADNGKEFRAGTGLTNKERAKPPSIGSRVTYRYQELTDDLIPRFPTFVSARDYE